MVIIRFPAIWIFFFVKYKEDAIKFTKKNLIFFFFRRMKKKKLITRTLIFNRDTVLFLSFLGKQKKTRQKAPICYEGLM